MAGKQRMMRVLARLSHDLSEAIVHIEQGLEDTNAATRASAEVAVEIMNAGLKAHHETAARAAEHMEKAAANLYAASAGNRPLPGPYGVMAPRDKEGRPLPPLTMRPLDRAEVAVEKARRLWAILQAYGGVAEMMGTEGGRKSFEAALLSMYRAIGQYDISRGVAPNSAPVDATEHDQGAGRDWQTAAIAAAAIVFVQAVDVAYGPSTEPHFGYAVVSEKQQAGIDIGLAELRKAVHERHTHSVFMPAVPSAAGLGTKERIERLRKMAGAMAAGMNTEPGPQYMSVYPDGFGGGWRAVMPSADGQARITHHDHLICECDDFAQAVDVATTWAMGLDWKAPNGDSYPPGMPYVYGLGKIAPYAVRRLGTEVAGVGTSKTARAMAEAWNNGVPYDSNGYEIFPPTGPIGQPTYPRYKYGRRGDGSWPVFLGGKEVFNCRTEERAADACKAWNAGEPWQGVAPPTTALGDEPEARYSWHDDGIASAVVMDGPRAVFAVDRRKADPTALCMAWNADRAYAVGDEVLHPPHVKQVAKAAEPDTLPEQRYRYYQRKSGGWPVKLYGATAFVFGTEMDARDACIQWNEGRNWQGIAPPPALKGEPEDEGPRYGWDNDAEMGYVIVDRWLKPPNIVHSAGSERAAQDIARSWSEGRPWYPPSAPGSVPLYPPPSHLMSRQVNPSGPRHE